MKKHAIILILILTAYHVISAENYISCSLDWQLSLRGGIEHRFDSPVGLKTDIGINVFGMVGMDAFVMFYLLPDTGKWQLNICAGMPNASLLPGVPAGMVSLGGSLMVRRRINDRLSIDLRLGEGFPFFFEEDEEVIRDIHFPLNLWPDFTLGLCFLIGE